MGPTVMTDKDKWVEALARLTRKTIEGEIRWQSVPASAIKVSVFLGGFTAIDKAYETMFREQRIRAYRESIGLSGETSRFIIEFLDGAGTAVYRPPILDGAKDLFSAIEYQAARVGDFIDALIRD